MEFNFEIDYTHYLVALTLTRTSNEIKRRKKNNNSDASAFENSNGYLIELNKNLEDFNVELVNFKSGILPKLVSRKLPSEINLMLVLYFKLVETLLHSLLVREGGVNMRLIISILSIFDKTINTSQKFIETNTVDLVASEKMTHSILELRRMLENELQVLLAKDVVIETNNRVDAEIDNIRSSLKDELKNISNQYSSGRAQLLDSVDEYKRTIEKIIDETKYKVNEYESDINKVSAGVNERNNKVDDLLKSAESCLAIANSVLEKTNQVGMAAAFQKRHKSLMTSMVVWFVTFFVSLAGLTYVGFIFIDSAFSSEIKTVVELVAKLAVSFPLVWGAWFAAKQYSHLSQLREDYAYKVAVAMTYHGYKNEAAEVNDEMSGKLLENIISQFSDNPVRLYKNNDSASVIEALLKNDKISDIINSAKNGVSNSAKKS